MTEQQREFTNGEFVYDPDDPWISLRTGIVFLRDGTWRVSFPRRLPEEKDEPPIDVPLAEYPGRIVSHILVNSRSDRGPKIDATPWLQIRDRALAILGEIRLGVRRR